jgi:hypothetical protein
MKNGGRSKFAPQALLARRAQTPVPPLVTGTPGSFLRQRIWRRLNLLIAAKLLELGTRQKHFDEQLRLADRKLELDESTRMDARHPDELPVGIEGFGAGRWSVHGDGCFLCVQTARHDPCHLRGKSP